MKSDGAPVTENESSENRDEENELSDVRNEPEMNEYFSLDTQLQSGEPNSYAEIYNTVHKDCYNTYRRNRAFCSSNIFRAITRARLNFHFENFENHREASRGIITCCDGYNGVGAFIVDYVHSRSFKEQFFTGVD